MAAPSVVDTDNATHTSGGGGTLQFVLPGGAPSNGDLLIMAGISGGTNKFITAPAGWDALEASTVSGRNAQIHYRFASGDSDTFNFTLTDTLTTAAGVLHRITGASNPLNWVDAEDATNTDPNAIISPAVIPPAVDSLVYRLVQVAQASQTIVSTNVPDPPTGYTRTTLSSPSNNPGTMLLDYFTHDDSSTGTLTYDTTGVTTVLNCITFAIAPAGAGDVTAPQAVSATVDGTAWTIEFDENVTGQTGFSATGSTTGAITLTGASGDGTDTHTFTGSPSAADGETVTLDYTPGNAEDDAENALEAISDMAVTNNTPSPTYPENTTPPTVTGEAAVDGSLNCDHGDWTNDPTSYAYQWQQDDGGNEVGENIVGATTADYTPVEGNLGNKLSCIVRGINAEGFDADNDTRSNWTSVVTESEAPPDPTAGLQRYGIDRYNLQRYGLDRFSLPRYSGAAPADTTAPLMLTPSVGAGGIIWTIPFNEAVAGTGGLSATGSTTGAITLTYVSGSGTSSHTYTGTQAAEGETITLTYTPTTLFDLAGNPLEAISDKAVTNGTVDEEPGDEVAPTLTSRVLSANGTTYTLGFSEAVTGTGGFTASASIQGAITLTYASGDGTDTHVYTGSPIVTDDETVTLDYTPGSIQDAALNSLAAINDAAVTNNSTVVAGTAPILTHPQVVWVEQGQALSFTPEVLQGESITFTCANLPAWASINSSTGEVTGTAPSDGEKTVLRIIATNSGGSFTIYATLHVWETAATVGTADKESWGGLLLNTAWCKYTLDGDLTCDGTAVAVQANGIGLDLDGNDVIYDNLVDEDLEVVNGDFETGDDTGWDLTAAGGDAVVAAGAYLSGQVAEEANGYSLQLTVPYGESRSVETVADITFDAGVTYAIEALVYNSQADSADTPCSVGIKGSADKGNISRSRQGSVGVYTFVASGTETGPLEFTISNNEPELPGGATFYIDRVRVTRARRVGIAVAGWSVTSGVPQVGDVPRAGTATDFTLDGGGGTISQGAQNSHDGSPIMARSTTRPTFQDTTLTWQGTAGVYGRGIYGVFAGSPHVQNIILYNNCRYIGNRDQRYGTGFHFTNNPACKIMNCTIHNSPQIAILFQVGTAGDCEVAYNKIYSKVRYTNGFGIVVNGDGITKGTSNKVHHNTIDNTLTSEHGGRGISFDNGTDTELYENDVRVQELPLNAEYGGTIANGAYACQAEGKLVNCNIHHNRFTSVNLNGNGTCVLTVKMESGAGNVNIDDNIVRLETDGTTIVGSGYPNPGNTLWLDGRLNTVDLSTLLTLDRNTFQSAERLAMLKRVHNFTLNGSTWETLEGGNGTISYFAEEGSSAGSSTMAMDMKFVDNIYANEEARTAFESFDMPAVGTASNMNDANSDSGNDNIELAWSITFHVTDTGVDQEGLTVDVYEAGTSTLAGTGETDADGNVTIILDEYRYASGVMGSQMAYDIQVETVEIETDYTPTQPETVELAI